MKKLILTEDDFYYSPTGRFLRGGDRPMYNADLVVYVKKDGSYEVLKDRFDLSKEEVRSIVEFDERSLLLLQ
jgi:hypothetical protein